MASSISTERLSAQIKVDVDRITGGTSVEGTWLDMQEYGSYMAIAQLFAKTGNGMTKLEILASASSDGSSPEVVKDSGTIAADAVTDVQVLECIEQELGYLGASAGKDLRYVAARVTLHNSGDIVSLTNVLGDAKNAQSGLTATAIA